MGKTTVTLGIAAELASRGAQVLLIDFDAQASATKALGVDVNGCCSMADAMLEPERTIQQLAVEALEACARCEV